MCMCVRERDRQTGRETERQKQRKCWTDKVKGLTSMPMPELLTMANQKKKKKRRKGWKRISA